MAGSTIVTSSGRKLGITGYGDPAADRLVLVCHPTPGAALDPDPTVTDRWGVHVVTLDRPGYDSSDVLPEQAAVTLEDHAKDVGDFMRRSERVADRISHARLERYGVVGWGTGGFVAAAIAASDPLVDRLALVGVPRPAKTERFLDRALKAPNRLAALGVTERDPDLERHLGLLNRLERMLDRAFLQGNAGVRSDARFFEDEGWTERLAGIRAETHVWVGDRDPLVADLDGSWWAKRIPGALASHVRDSGPLTIAAAWSHVLAHVAPDHGSIAPELRDSGSVALAGVDRRHPEEG